MVSFIWKNGQFSWWFIGFALLLAGSWLAIDVLWRVVDLPFMQFIGTALLTQLILLTGYLWLWHRNR